MRLALSFTCLWLPIQVHAAVCDVANPVLPCEIGGTIYDTFAGNYSQNRSFYRASSYDESIVNGYLSLTLKDNLPHTEGYAFVANYGATVWTSPSPYNASFGIFGQFNGSGVQLANNFEWVGEGAAQPPLTSDMFTTSGSSSGGVPSAGTALANAINYYQNAYTGKTWI